MLARIIILPVIISVLMGVITLIMRDINIVVPSFTDKIDRLVAGVILIAITVPQLGVTGRHM